MAAGWRVHVEIELRRGFPVIADVAEQSGDEAKEGFRVWEDASDAGAAFDLLVDAFSGVGGAAFPEQQRPFPEQQRPFPEQQRLLPE